MNGGGVLDWFSSEPSVPTVKSPFSNYDDNDRRQRRVNNPPFNPQRRLDSVYNARDFMNENGVGSKLTMAEADEINSKIESEKADPSSTNKIVEEGLNKATQFEGKIRKAIIASISTYNVLKNRGIA